MKYLKRFNESKSEEDFDFDEIKDIFQDFLDEGFKLEDVSVGSSLSIAPELWCNNHRFFPNNQPFKSVTIKLDSAFKDVYGPDPKYDFSILQVLDECIKHFESYYRVKLDSIYTVGIHTTEKIDRQVRGTIYNWFNSCETIKDIAKAHKLSSLKVSRLALTFQI
jgi:hypothetical protein